MAKEYIERSEFREVLKKSHEAHANNSREASLLDRDIRLLNEQPAADVVEVKHGEWEKCENDGYEWFQCSRCQNRPLNDYNERPVFSDYCPNCGSDMRERRDDDATC